MSDNLDIILIEDKQKVDRRLKDLNPLLPTPPFKMLLVGSSGSGKSNFLLNLFRKEFYGKKKSGVFLPDNIVVVSPSADIDPKIKKIPSNNIFTDFNEDIINEIVETQSLIKQIDGKHKMPHVLLILEDCLDTEAFRRNSLIERICYRIRHYNVSIIITCQKFSAIPRGLRLNTDIIHLFQCYNESEYDHIVEEIADKEDKPKLRKLIKNVMKIPYQFLTIENKFNSEHPSKFRVGLNEFVDLT